MNGRPQPGGRVPARLGGQAFAATADGRRTSAAIASSRLRPDCDFRWSWQPIATKPCSPRATGASTRRSTGESSRRRQAIRFHQQARCAARLCAAVSAGGDRHSASLDAQRQRHLLPVHAWHGGHRKTGRSICSGRSKGTCWAGEYNNAAARADEPRRIGDTYQGAVYPFSREPVAGEATFEGPIAYAVAPDGDVYVGNLPIARPGRGRNTGSLVRLRPPRASCPVGLQCGPVRTVYARIYAAAGGGRSPAVEELCRRVVPADCDAAL